MILTVVEVLVLTITVGNFLCRDCVLPGSIEVAIQVLPGAVGWEIV